MCIVKKRNEKRKKRVGSTSCNQTYEKVSDMSAGESDDLLLHSINSNTQHPKISLQLLPNGHIFVDWNDLPKHRKIRQCVIHYKSLNNNRVNRKSFFSQIKFLSIRVMLYESHVKNKILSYKKFNQGIYTKYMYVLLVVRIKS